MNGAKNAVVAAVIATGAAWMLSVAVVGGQAAQAPADRAPNSEDVFKNIQVLKGIPVDQFMGTMGFFSSSLGLNCTDCHTYDSGGDWAKYADDTPLKRRARAMVTMMQKINQDNFGGRQVVTCNTCHRGVSRPNVMPSIDQLYGTPPPEEPGDPITQAAGQPTADSIIDKYIAAVGGAQKVAAFTSFTASGYVSGLRRFRGDAARGRHELDGAVLHGRAPRIRPAHHDERRPAGVVRGAADRQAVPVHRADRRRNGRPQSCRRSCSSRPRSKLRCATGAPASVPKSTTVV
jgi:hypothetical protein